MIMRVCVCGGGGWNLYLTAMKVTLDMMIVT